MLAGVGVLVAGETGGSCGIPKVGTGARVGTHRRGVLVGSGCGVLVAGTFVTNTLGVLVGSGDGVLVAGEIGDNCSNAIVGIGVRVGKFVRATTAGARVAVTDTAAVDSGESTVKINRTAHTATAINTGITTYLKGNPLLR